MQRLSVGDLAPEFHLPNHEGAWLRLSELRHAQNVLLVFNLGFVWPHCTNHMAQLRHDYAKFQALKTEVVVIVPNGPKTIARYLHSHPISYLMLSDKGARVTAQYGIDTRHVVMTAFKPSVFLVDQAGQIIYLNYEASYIAEPDNQQPLAVLARLSAWKLL